MEGRMVGFAHARGAGEWLSASPRVQRLVAAHIAVVLGTGLTGVALHQSATGATEPLALATALGPTSGPVPVAVAEAPSPPHTEQQAASRAASTPRPKPKPK